MLLSQQANEPPPGWISPDDDAQQQASGELAVDPSVEAILSSMLNKETQENASGVHAALSSLLQVCASLLSYLPTDLRDSMSYPSLFGRVYLCVLLCMHVRACVSLELSTRKCCITSLVVSRGARCDYCHCVLCEITRL